MIFGKVFSVIYLSQFPSSTLPFLSHPILLSLVPQLLFNFLYKCVLFSLPRNPFLQGSM